MTLDPAIATAFITGCMRLLLEIAGRSRAARTRNALAILAASRSRLAENPALMDEAFARLNARSDHVDEEIFRAVRTLRVTDWVFLRDTKAYPVFVHPSETIAFGVLGLTEPIRDIAGSSGVALETGIVQFAGRFVCDGLVSRIGHLGPSYRRSFSSVYSAAKAKGCFHVRAEA